MRHCLVTLLFGVFVLTGACAHAQTYTRTIVHAGDSLSTYYTYQFPTFADANMLLKDGRRLKYKMNFNLLLCEMQFIDPKGDTLVIAKPEEIDFILLNNSSFFFDRGYNEVLVSSEALKLVVLRQVSFEPVKIGAMEAPARSSSAEAFNSTFTQRGMMPLVMSEDIYVSKKTTYLLIGKDGERTIATKSNFLKVFASDKKNIENFLKSNEIDFSKQGDLEKLFHFCTEPKSYT
jgi:hypothetical protein